MGKQAWLIRPKPNDQVRINEFMEEDFIAVGWPGLGSLRDLREHDIRERLQAKYGENNSALATLKMVVYRMKEGDYVVVPYEKTVYFGRIKSEYLYFPNRDTQETGYPHAREVEWFKTILERTELPEPLQKSLRVVRTAAELTQHVDIIEGLLEKEFKERKKAFELMMKLTDDDNLDDYYMDDEYMDDDYWDYEVEEPEVKPQPPSNQSEDTQLIEKAKLVLQTEINHEDPWVRLRAAEIILNTLQTNKK
ncbi:hypothetical protein A8F94_00405 [Bacillus sp. FJAT-27225]|uniref:restriction endonuclease n=1 Tax=Bacillus sp. FJAT-27225 TaxID=1743144 RepID=UPI00080C25DB|nr:hypothetical protein [Bacillus sp. FJAT-27225]OCA90394.1 hypothetical protein A8F94_00405 [Bacillus sp. FJAT-27225]